MTEDDWRFLEYLDQEDEDSAAESLVGYSIQELTDLSTFLAGAQRVVSEALVTKIHLWDARSGIKIYGGDDETD